MGNGVTLRVTDMLYQPVVCALVMGDVTTEVKDGEIQQAVDHEIEHRDDATGTTVAVVEGVDAFKLVMNDGHFDQRVYVVQRGVIDVLLQIVHQSLNFAVVLRWDVDNFIGIIPQCGTRHGTKASAVFDQFRLYLLYIIQCEQALLPC